MIVYTFWEPRENIPTYLRLCMETWKKFLPNTKIVVLDYKNINEYIDLGEFSSNLFSGAFKLPLIADAIRVALLAKHGGVWLDTDTIILSSNAEKYFPPDKDNRIIFFGSPDRKTAHVAFINAPPNAKCMTCWLEVIKEKIKNFTDSTKIDSFFMANSFINGYIKEFPNEINLLSRKLIMPELSSSPNPNKALIPERRAAYADYYFNQNYHLKDVSSDMILLHHSWTPNTFKKLSLEELLRYDCTMTNILAEALEMTLPPPHTVCAFKSKSELRIKNSLSLQNKNSPPSWWGNFFMRI